MDRWTIKQLNEISDIDFAIAVLSERKNKQNNPYTPLSRKLDSTIAFLQSIKEEKV